MSSTATIAWWNSSITEIGPRAMDQHLSDDSNLKAFLASGRQDVERVIELTGMQVRRDWTVLANYLSDAFTVLKPDGQLVLKLNAEEIGIGTILARAIRRVMHVSGKTKRRGWPNGAGGRHVWPSVQSTVSLLTELGFRVDRTIADNPRQIWIVARKPDWQRRSV